jgi:hypothetical protein
LYDEEYGSQAKFAVACPATAFWQNTIAETLVTLVEDYDLDGREANKKSKWKLLFDRLS